MTTVQAIANNQIKPKRSVNIALATAVGGVVGVGARYILPRKNQVDEFVSSAKEKAKSRSILKYAGIGAIIAAGIAIISKIHANKKQKENDFEYTKLNALIDAPDYACEIMWYGE